jgi:hypothetical protein
VLVSRGNRIRLGTAILGTGALFVFAVALRDHLESWRFQLTRETKTVTPDCGDSNSPPILCLLARSSGRRIIYDPQDSGALSWSSALRSPAGILGVLRCFGWRVIEQRFLRRAFVIIHDNQ